MASTWPYFCFASPWGTLEGFLFLEFRINFGTILAVATPVPLTFVDALWMIGFGGILVSRSRQVQLRSVAFSGTFSRCPNLRETCVGTLV